MLVKTVYPKNFEKRPINQIEIPREMVNFDLWREKAFVYALSRSTVGIADREIAEWNGKSLSKEVVPIKKTDDNIVLELPSHFSDFYQLANSETALSAIGNLVFVTVETILPVKISTKNSQEKYAIAPN